MKAKLSVFVSALCFPQQHLPVKWRVMCWQSCPRTEVLSLGSLDWVCDSSIGIRIEAPPDSRLMSKHPTFSTYVQANLLHDASCISRGQASRALAQTSFVAQLHHRHHPQIVLGGPLCLVGKHSQLRGHWGKNRRRDLYKRSTRWWRRRQSSRNPSVGGGEQKLISDRG